MRKALDRRRNLGGGRLEPAGGDATRPHLATSITRPETVMTIQSNLAPPPAQRGPAKARGALGRGPLQPGAGEDETKWSFLRQLILAFAADGRKRRSKS